MSTRPDRCCAPPRCCRTRMPARASGLLPVTIHHGDAFHPCRCCEVEDRVSAPPPPQRSPCRLPRLQAASPTSIRASTRATSRSCSSAPRTTWCSCCAQRGAGRPPRACSSRWVGLSVWQCVAGPWVRRLPGGPCWFAGVVCWAPLCADLVGCLPRRSGRAPPPTEATTAAPTTSNAAGPATLLRQPQLPPVPIRLASSCSSARHSHRTAARPAVCRLNLWIFLSQA